MRPLRAESRVSGESCTRLSDAAGRCLGCSATDTCTNSKIGRIRTHSVGFGGRLLSQEHDLIGSRLAATKLPRQDSNLQPSA